MVRAVIGESHSNFARDGAIGSSLDGHDTVLFGGLHLCNLDASHSVRSGCACHETRPCTAVVGFDCGILERVGLRIGEGVECCVCQVELRNCAILDKGLGVVPIVSVSLRNDILA